MIQLNIMGAHRDSTHFPEPELFNPERWLEISPKVPFFPFGDGPKIW